MHPLHVLLALILMMVWGCNFIFVQFALEEIPPLFLSVLRFVFASIPIVFFIKRPVTSFKMVALYGFVNFGLQFALVFMGMKAGMAPGFTSLILQIQIFFSVFLAAFFLGEIPSLWQMLGALVAFSGIVLALVNLDAEVSLIGFILVLLGALAWGMGNLISKKIPHENMISLVVWGSLVAILPLLLLSLIFEGPARIVHSVHHISWLMILAIAYIVYISTWFGYGAWNWLLSQYPVATVAPFTLLVPVFGVMSSIIVFNEPMQSWKIAAGILVFMGLCINLLGQRLMKKT